MSDVLDVPAGVVPDEGEFVRAAMQWHFSPETGSPFWLRRAATLDFDPRTDVGSFADLRLFPNVTDELRDVPTQDLIPAGFGRRPDIVAVIESGGTTGIPKRLPMLREFADRMAAAEAAYLADAGVSKTGHWLSMFPSGPHGALDQARRSAAAYGDGILVFAIDLDPRWVKKLAKQGPDAMAGYVDHVVEQGAWVLQTQDVSSLRLTAPVLAKLAADDRLADLVREKIRYIGWGGAQMDPDSRYLYRTEIFPEATLRGAYGTTMALGGGCRERPGLGHDDPCIYDPNLSPYVTLDVVDPDTRERVALGERGQVVVHHISRSFLLPNNAERDLATRIAPVRAQIGDSVADIAPMPDFKGAVVVEGVY